MILTRLEWVTLLTSHWRHLLVTLFTRAADKLDLFTADHPLISLIAQSAEFLNIIWRCQFLNEYKTVNVMLREPLKKKIFLQVSDLKERFWARDSYLPSYRKSFWYSSTNRKKSFLFLIGSPELSNIKWRCVQGVISNNPIFEQICCHDIALFEQSLDC